jgi:hypothetical protein
VSVTKDAPVGALAGLSALPKNTLENFAKWGAALLATASVRMIAMNALGGNGGVRTSGCRT